MSKLFYSKIIAAILFILFTFKLSAHDKNNSDSKSDSSKSRYTIDNCVNTFNMNKIEKTGVGYQYWFADKNFLDGRTIKMSVVKPHSTTHPPHSHPEDEFFFVLEGTAELYLAGKTKVAGPLTSFYCPS